MLNQRRMDREQRAGGHRQPLQSSSRRDGEHLVEHPIAIAKMVMKRQRRPVGDAACGEGGLDTIEQLVAFARVRCNACGARVTVAGGGRTPSKDAIRP